MLKKLLSVVLFFFLLITISSFAQNTITSDKWIKVADGLNFPEGPASDGNGSIYFSNCYGGWIGKLKDSKLDTFVIKVNSRININKTNGLAFGKDNYLYACEYGYGQILRVDEEANVEVYVNGFNGEKFNRPNDIVLDNEGNLFFTDPKSYDSNVLDGRLFFVNAKTKEVKIVADSLAFPNGVNISPLDKKLYLCESAKHKIVRFDIDENMNLYNKEDFISLPGGDPDGIEFDNQGNLYVAHYGGKAVYKFSPEGKQITKFETPGSKPTNLEFGDKDFKVLYLTEVETNSLYKIILDK